MSNPSDKPWRDPSEYKKDEITTEQRETIEAANAMFRHHDAMSEAMGLPTLNELLSDINKK